ncbi:MAG: cbb3-type cytochrome c oxidase subunit I, partial [Candidatus Brocadiales bacterium]
LAFLATFSFISMAGIYHIIPRISGVQMSHRLAKWHFWLFIGGLVVFLGVLHTAGVVQGAMWSAKIEEIDFVTDAVILRPAVQFIDVVRMLHPFYVAVLAGASLMVCGIMIFVFNVLKTACAAAGTETGETGSRAGESDIKK